MSRSPTIEPKAVLLCALNARYSHTAFGLRYLFAGLGDLQARAGILEFTIAQNPRDIVEAILRHGPQIVGLGIYIWNARLSLEVVALLKALRPALKVVLGGPEVSYETELQSICAVADLTIRGEADSIFAEVCRDYLGGGTWPERKWIAGPLPEIKKIASPYPFYSDEDIRNRVIYVEASRGCPYKCEYCLSSLDQSVRSFDLDRFLSDLEELIERGARQFKFVDRTFNLSPTTSARILRFFLAKMDLGLFLHFEMVPDRLPPELREIIRKFPVGSLQFEIGIQTWNPEVARRVSRRLDFDKIRENFAFLTRETGVHLHADLIAGLPGETLESFARGFDAVYALGPQEIQVGILKRLRGTPIIRHDAEWGMAYEAQAPYQVVRTRTMGFETLQRLGRFSRFWDLVANSGNFKQALGLLEELARARAEPSLFWEFDELSRWLAVRHPQGHGIALLSLLESVWLYLGRQRGVDEERVREALTRDYTGTIKRDVPAFLRGDARLAFIRPEVVSRPIPKRQQKHLGAQ